MFDDLVSPNELNDKQNLQQQHLQGPLNQQVNANNPKTFFTTLNPADLHRNINEFINDDGINFLQDSEIQMPAQIPPQQTYQQHVDVQQAEQQHHIQQQQQQQQQHQQPQQVEGLQYQPQLVQQTQQPQQMHPNMQSNNYGAQPPQQQQQYVQMNQGVY